MFLKVASPVWLFDLDNTLHDASPHIFPHLNRAMVAYIRDHLGVDEQAATRIRQDYWQRYGATLLGLMRHHGTDPQHFLWHTHQFPDLKHMLVLERGLRAMLLRLPGRKIVFSNAPLHYSEAVLELAGIDACFDAVYSIERIRFQPKPAIGGFRHLLRSERLPAHRCIMVEDTLANLQTAKRLGMQTVWVCGSTRQPSFVDLRLVSILDLPRGLQHLSIGELL
ncbi:MAG: phosphoglycolate phosphatase [Candidatus Accumulibacter phosphatis]|uniref:Phosphoglycolate phosphatase n=1 Tax=Candidatus Accumulibacter phosphatis TaxID=327160 RepID=A0A080M728_9PROT|nr:pyrimidine 5'-nucleotidase [Accumulibacter sp.]KFB72929.1 MAG: phosphoglycolate phosphatase [Candidatus Accumulibacter phosphatis]HRF10894.1 pyrimidine 5'-nucleotidase [Candidatus Accumulibacter phosphatis]